jgi:hypothetical protein
MALMAAQAAIARADGGFPTGEIRAHLVPRTHVLAPGGASAHSERWLIRQGRRSPENA